MYLIKWALTILLCTACNRQNPDPPTPVIAPEKSTTTSKITPPKNVLIKEIEVEDLNARFDAATEFRRQIFKHLTCSTDVRALTGKPDRNQICGGDTR